LKRKIKLTKNTKQKIKIKRMRTKFEKKIKNQDYQSRDETENKLKFDKRAKNQNIEGLILNIIKL
jgi:hypothetical protein